MFFDKRKPHPPRRRLMPMMPLRDLVLFPHMAVPLIIGRDSSVLTLTEVARGDKEVFFAAQKEAKTNNPSPDEIHEIGTFAAISQMLRLPDGTVRIVVEGRRRGRIVRFVASEGVMRVEVEDVEETTESSNELEALVRQAKAAFDQYGKTHRTMPQESPILVSAIDDPGRLADVIIAQLKTKIEQRQSFLQELNPAARLEALLKNIQSEIEILQVERKIKSRVKKQVEKSQKEYYLNEQLQAIQKELGEKDEFRSELQELEARVFEKPMSDEAKDRCLKEMRKLRMMSPMSAEATVVRNYLDSVLALPWETYTEDRIDLAFAAKDNSGVVAGFISAVYINGDVAFVTGEGSFLATATTPATGWETSTTGMVPDTEATKCLSRWTSGVTAITAAGATWVWEGDCANPKANPNNWYVLEFQACPGVDSDKKE
jgi:ATP-dependent Lon protease